MHNNCALNTRLQIAIQIPAPEDSNNAVYNATRFVDMSRVPFLSSDLYTYHSEHSAGEPR